jgi:hypothetical protein
MAVGTVKIYHKLSDRRALAEHLSQSGNPLRAYQPGRISLSFYNSPHLERLQRLELITYR